MGHGCCVSKLCFLYSALRPPSMDFSLWRDLCWLGALSRRSQSDLLSISVALCTNVSAVSHMMSLTGSLGSIRRRCWRMERKGIS